MLTTTSESQGIFYDTTPTSSKGRLPNDFNEMCFFDQKVFKCGDWKWGVWREGCWKSPQKGDSCGIMLIMSSQFVEDLCGSCLKIETKRRHIRKLEEKIQRWSKEPNRTASIDMAKQDIHNFAIEIADLDTGRIIRNNGFTHARYWRSYFDMEATSCLNNTT